MLTEPFGGLRSDLREMQNGTSYEVAAEATKTYDVPPGGGEEEEVYGGQATMTIDIRPAP